MLADCLLILFLIQKLEKLKKTPPDIRGLFTNTAFDKNATKKFLIMLNLIPVYSMQNENKENMQQKKILLMLSKVLLKIKKIKQKH